MENKKVSVIMPILNNEQSLPRCLESIRAQQHTNFEVLMVCDVGKDNSHIICEEWEKKDERFRALIRREEKSSLSIARNFGLDHLAKDSDFVIFVDADDWVEPEYLAYLVEGMDKGADMACCDYKTSKDTNRHVKVGANNLKFLTPSEMVKFLISKSRMTFVTWNKLYKTSLIGDLRFEEYTYFAEDTLWVYLLMQRCEKIAFTDQKLYHYIKNPGSMTASYKIDKRLQEIDTYERISKMAEGVSETDGKYFRAWQYLMMLEKLHFLNQSKQNHPEARKQLVEVINYCRPYYKMCKKDFVFYRKLGGLLEKLLGV